MLLRIILNVSLINAEMMLHFEAEGRWTVAGLAFDFYDLSMDEITSNKIVSMKLQLPCSRLIWHHNFECRKLYVDLSKLSFVRVSSDHDKIVF
jgi:hypothetical protein